MKYLDPANLLTYVDLSTGHITKEDAALLGQSGQQSADPIIARPYDEGWFLSVTSDYTRNEALEAGYSPELYDIIEAAQRQGLDLIRFDADGAIDESFPVFDW